MTVITSISDRLNLSFNTRLKEHKKWMNEWYFPSAIFMFAYGALQHFALNSLQFFSKEILQMPPISESMADHNSGNYVPYFLWVFWVL